MKTEWKLVPVEPTREMLVAALKTNGACPVYAAMLAAAPIPPNFIACHVDESCGQGGGEVEDIGEDAIRDLASSACQSALYEGVNEEAFARLARTVASRAHAHVTRLTAEIAHVRHLMTDAYNCGVAEAKENDALKAEVGRLNEERDGVGGLKEQLNAMTFARDLTHRSHMLAESELTKARELIARVLKSGALTHEQFEGLEADCCAIPAATEIREPKCVKCHDQGEVHSGKMIEQGYWQPPEPEMVPCPNCAFGNQSAPAAKGEGDE